MVKTITAQLITDSTIEESIERIENLFVEESIKYKSDLNSIYSTNVPLPLFGFDLRQYSRRNWIGINPFIFISRIKVLLNKTNDDSVLINITIRQNRALIIYSFILLLLLIVAVNLPQAWIGFLFFVFFALLFFGFIFLLCINRFIKKEIIDAISS